MGWLAGVVVVMGSDERRACCALLPPILITVSHIPHLPPSPSLPPSIDILRLLSLPGAHHTAVQSILDASDVWGAYRDQRHEMFLPGAEDRQSGVVGLLTGGEVATFALPAKEGEGAAQ